MSAASTGTPAGGEERLHISESLSAATWSARQEADHRERLPRIFLVVGIAALVGLVVCCALAVFAADFEAGEESASISATPLRRAAEVTRVAVRPCRSAQAGEPCHSEVMRAMTVGIKEDKDLFLGLTDESTFEDFQALLAQDPYSGCPQPCSTAEASDAATEVGTDTKVLAAGDVKALGVIGYPADSRIVAQGQWCSVSQPQQGWAVRGCGRGTGLKIKVLTYNLYWWNLYGRRNGNGGSAGHLIASAHAQQPFDLMGFQECEDIFRVLKDSNLLHEFEPIPGPHAMCMAYRKTAWRRLGAGSQNVGEDRWDQWYGTRAGMWVRVQHMQTGEVVFFINHHGPLPVDTGGMCGGEATAYNLLKLIANFAYTGDVVVLVGDFNAGPGSQTVQQLNGRLQPIFTGKSFGGVDHVLSSCNRVAETRNLGSGGSDHDALETVIQL